MSTKTMDLKAARIILQGINLFKALSDEELNELLPFIKLATFPAKSILIQQGKFGEGMYIIKKGRVQINVRLPGNIENKIAVLNKFNFVGEVTLIEGGVTTASVITLVDTECYFLSRENFNALQICKPLLTYKITTAINQGVCDRLRHINSEVAGKLVDVKKSLSKFAKPKLSKPIPASLTNLTAAGININFLMTLGIFKHFKSTECAELLRYMQLRQAGKQQLIFKEGDEATGTFYIIVQGAVQIMLSKGNKLAKLSVNGPGGICGQLSYIDSKAGMATAIAREDVILLEVKQADITLLKEKNSALFYKWHAVISQPFISMLRTSLKDLTRLATQLGT